MKRRNPTPPYSPAELRELNRRLFQKVMKATRTGTKVEIYEVAREGFLLNEDRRTNAAVTRGRGIEHTSRLVRLLEDLPGYSDGITLREVREECADRGLPEYHRETISDILDLMGIIRKPDKPGPKRKR